MNTAAKTYLFLYLITFVAGHALTSFLQLWKTVTPICKSSQIHGYNRLCACHNLLLHSNSLKLGLYRKDTEYLHSRDTVEWIIIISCNKGSHFVLVFIKKYFQIERQHSRYEAEIHCLYTVHYFFPFCKKLVYIFSILPTPVVPASDCTTMVGVSS